MKKTVYVLGNPLLKIDSKPVQMLPVLQENFPQIRFIRIDPTEEFFLDSASDLILIDTVIGLRDPVLITDMNKWQLSSRVSVHDFDLPISLGILKKLGKIKSVKIIGVPVKGSLKKLNRQVARLLTAI